MIDQPFFRFILTLFLLGSTQIAHSAACSLNPMPYWGTFPYHCPFVSEEKFCLVALVSNKVTPTFSQVDTNHTYATISATYGIRDSVASWRSYSYTTEIPSAIYGLSILQVDTCLGQDSIAMVSFDTNFVFVPDSISLKVGDTLVLRNYRLSWTPFEGINKASFTYDSSAFSVHGITYGGRPSSLLPAFYHTPSASFVNKLSSGWLLKNPTKRQLRLNIIDTYGRVLDFVLLEPGEQRKIDYTVNVLVKLVL